VQTSFLPFAKITTVIFCNTRHSPNKFGSALAYAKSVTEKNNIRVDCAEACKKTVQAMRYEWWGFLQAGGLPCGAARNLLSGET